VHLPVVRSIERVASASHRHRRRWSIAREPRAFPDAPRLIAPMSSFVNSTRSALKPAGASHVWNKNERDGKVDQAKGKMKQAVATVTKAAT
jgi:hypothetical protein